MVNDIKRGQLVKNSTKETAKLVRQEALTSHFRASVVIALPKMWVFASAAKSSINHKAEEAWSAKPRVGV